GEDDVGLAALDHAEALADVAGAGGAGGDHAGGGAGEPVAHRHVAAGHVGDQHGDEEGAHAHGGALEADAGLLLPRLEATDARTDAGAGVVAGHLLGGQARVAHSQLGCDEGEVHEAVEALGLAPLDVLLDVDLHLAGDLHRQVGGGEARDGADAVTGLVLRLQELLGAHADRRHGPNSGYDDSSHDCPKITCVTRIDRLARCPGAPRRRGTGRARRRDLYCLSLMNLTASPTVRMPSASSSEISTPNSSSRPMISSTTSRESAPRSSMKRDSSVTSPGSASSL